MIDFMTTTRYEVRITYPSGWHKAVSWGTTPDEVNEACCYATLQRRYKGKALSLVKITEETIMVGIGGEPPSAWKAPKQIA